MTTQRAVWIQCDGCEISQSPCDLSARTRAQAALTCEPGWRLYVMVPGRERPVDLCPDCAEEAKEGGQ